MTAITPRLRRQPVPLHITFVVAVAWTIVAAIWTIITVATDILATSIPAPLDVASFWFKVNPTQKLDGIHAAVTGGGYDHATFVISGLGMDARLYYAAANLIVGGGSCVLAIAIALLCNRVGRGDPFDLAVPRAFTVSGITVLVGGFLWQVFTQLAGLRVIEETFHSHGYSYNTAAGGIHEGSVGWPSGIQNFDISSWPIGVALALFAIAVVLRYGAGLSRERAALAEEVKGLV